MCLKSKKRQLLLSFNSLSTIKPDLLDLDGNLMYPSDFPH